VIDPQKQAINDAFLERLWKAVCTRLIGETLQLLKSGKQLSYAGVAVTDVGVHLRKKKLLGSEPAYRSWQQVSYYSQNGSLILVDVKDKSVCVEIPYLTTPNAHLLEAIIRLSFKNWKGKLSGFLESGAR
jgi:hypothetical protein